MDKNLQLSGKFKIAMFVLIAIGLVTVIAGFMSGEMERTWANLLLNNFYFFMLAIGGAFWLAMQAITQSGWSAGLLRIPQAMGNYIIISFFLWIVMFFGLHDLFHWSHPEAVAHDALLQHKEPYLNVTFLIIRYVVFFVLWIYLTQRLRKLSLEEDKHGGLTYFYKAEFTSKVFIFVFAFSFSLFTIDWLMSLDAHWFSTVYPAKMFISAFFHGAAIVTAIVIILWKQGYLPFVNKSHFHDLSKYIFALSIIWAYLWFAQYLLIWYANIPEETIYYVPRTLEYYKFFFYAELIVNWLFPFLFLMWNRIAKNPNALLFTVIVVSIGQWIELYMAIFPDTVEQHAIGWLEIGTALGFWGIFAFTVGWSLSKMNLVPKNHPYIQESIHHHA
jgi:hypothetical protein